MYPNNQDIDNHSDEVVQDRLDRSNYVPSYSSQGVLEFDDIEEEEE